MFWAGVPKLFWRFPKLGGADQDDAPSKKIPAHVDSCSHATVLVMLLLVNVKVDISTLLVLT